MDYNNISHKWLMLLPIGVYVMEKKDLVNFLFGIMNKQTVLFSDISLNDEMDAIFVKSVDGKRFIITVNLMTENEALIELWAKKNPELMYLAFSLINMRDLGIFTEEETHSYLSEIIEKADNSCIGDVKSGIKHQRIAIWIFDCFINKMPNSIIGCLWR